MSKPENQPKTNSAIAEAIRSKRGGSGSSAPVDLEALEAALVAEIEKFELCTAVPAEDRSGQAPKPGSRSPRQFPEIMAEGASRIQPPGNRPPVSPTADTLPKGTPPLAPKVSLLDQLRQQAQTQQQDSSTRSQQLALQKKRTDVALRTVFSYCHELVQQLNILHPPVERHYALLGSFEFSGLEWQEGFADYRTRQDGTNALYETVTLNCQLAKGEQIRIERDVLTADNFRKALFDLGLTFTCDEVRNSRHMVEKVIFSISTEVRINLRWQADLERGLLVLETRNLERFGNLGYEIPPDSGGPDLLDEFARLLLGQSNRFRNCCSNFGATAYSR